MNKVPLKFNVPQKRFVVNQPRESTNIWSRGTGKSFIIAYLIHLIVETMPRSAWLIAGQTYRQLLTRTLPGTLNALNKLGYEYERDYYIRKKPPAKVHFEKPFEAPLSYDNFIIFRNGTGFHLSSQDAGGGSSRGLNIDGIISDESLLLDKEKFDREISSTNRGNLRHFGHLPWHHGTFHFSSMPYGQEGAWLLEKSKYYTYDFTYLRKKIIQHQLSFLRTQDKKERLYYWEKICRLKKMLRFYKSKEGEFYSEADIFDNLSNVGLRFIEQQFRDLTDFVFMVEILNQRIEKIEGGFYPDLNRYEHGYRHSFDNSYIKNLEYGSDEMRSNDCRFDGDLVKGQPLRIAVDWGSKINCMTVCQYSRSSNTLRFLKNLYVKHPNILDDLADSFCHYYRFHNEKTVYFAYDHTGNTQMANSNITYAEQFTRILKKAGWTVYIVSKGAPLTHQQKYLLWSRLLRSKDAQTPTIRFNLNNCHETFVSMEQAPAKESTRGIEKDKSSERSNIPQEQATHLSDTADLQVAYLFSDILQHMPSFIDVMY